MPVVSEETGAPPKRSRAPAWVAAGLLAVLLLTVAVLPLTECRVTVGPVVIDCGRIPWDPWLSDFGFAGFGLSTPSSGDYVFHLGRWYWAVMLPPE